MKKPTNIYLGDKQTEEMKKISDKTGLKRSELIRRAIDEYLLKYRSDNE